MGFTRRGLGSAVAWGIGAGIASSIAGFVVVREWSLPPDLLLELAIGIPLWFMVASPFQEFLFRGWLQPQLETWLGRGAGLLVATIVFTLWHYLWPLAAHSRFPLHTLRGLLATFAAGLAYGYSFQRTGNILAPWLGHALSGIVFVLMGAGSFGEMGL
jgi:membrane protease YdiL (CAAX protease family)